MERLGEAQVCPAISGVLSDHGASGRSVNPLCEDGGVPQGTAGFDSDREVLEPMAGESSHYSRGDTSGDLTFLFTDIEGSTKLWQDRAEAMGVSLRRHDAILRSAISERGGEVFSTAGDAFAAAFVSAVDAVTAATTAQQALAGETWGDAEIRVRMGLHAGQAEHRDNDYFGPVLNRTARIMSAASGGQVLISEAVRSLGAWV